MRMSPKWNTLTSMLTGANKLSMGNTPAPRRHQGSREAARRRRQALNRQLEMAGSHELHLAELERKWGPV